MWTVRITMIIHPTFHYHFRPILIHHTVDNLGMDGVNERRPSAAVPPAWLEPKQQPYTNVFVSGSDSDAGQSGMRSPTRLTAAAAAEGKSMEEGYRLNVPPKILINVAHDRNYY